MRFFKPVIAAAALMIAFASCKKDSNSIDTTPNFYFVNGGPAGFDDNLILFPSADTLTFNMIISSTYLPSKEVTIMLSVEDSSRQYYNSVHFTNYQQMPPTAYSFQTSITGTTESVYDTIPVKLNKQFLGGEDYMLPVVITSISQYKLDTSRRVLYLHTSGNKLAGIYASTSFKTSYDGDAAGGTISDTATTKLIKNLAPVSSTQSQLNYAELGSNGWKYLLTYANGTFIVDVNDVAKSSVQSGSFTIITSTFNPLTKDIYIKSSYKNLSGDERIVEESLTLQK